MKKSVLYCDICWPQNLVDIEYHGRHDHLSASDFDADRARVNALREMGMQVIELTAAQVADFVVFEEIVLSVCGSLGKRLANSTLGATPARLELRRVLSDWRRNGGLHLAT